MKNTVTINDAQRLYVIAIAKGYTCLGFDVLENRAKRLANELGVTWENGIPSISRYNEYMNLIEKARFRHVQTGWRSQSELTPQFIGMENKKVKVVDCYGETRIFIIGKSTGFIPCHLELKNRRSTGGMAVMGSPFKSIQFQK